jgi:endonuclease YncB( thermonuclease family)
MRMIGKWIPAVVIVGLVGLHFQFPRPQAQPSGVRQSAVGESATMTSGRSATIVPGSIHDGDTLRIRQGEKVTKVRFCGIDAPELAQPLGVESRDYLKRLVGDGAVRVVMVEKDKYDRTVAELFLADGRSVNVEMVRAGMAYHYAKYSGNCSVKGAIVQAESQAQVNRLGVWAGRHQKPWEYRQDARLHTLK